MSISEKTLLTLEYGKIMERLRAYLQSDMGREYALSVQPATELDRAEELLEETAAADAVARRSGTSPMEPFPDIREMLQKVHAAHALSAGELLKVSRCLAVSRRVRDILQAETTPELLLNRANRLSSHRSIEEEIRRCILSEDEIADDASPELARIRRQIRLTDERMRDRLNAMLKNPGLAPYLQEAVITVRNGRFVLPVKAEHAGKVAGVLQDRSGSGQTLFVEPTAAMEMDNELRRLRGEETVEIGRILAGLTSLVDPVASELLASLHILGELDVLFAKALYGRDIRAKRPKLNREGRISIVGGRHPLLAPEKAVPIDVRLGETFRTLIITGPNTGGKTVTLKTVGLFSLMAASGLFVPAEAGTELSVFDSVYADIGDEQSIEQSLSTFSSHMTNTVRILKEAGEDSLVLLDELGAGTDPIEGAALAQAILETLYRTGCVTMATTHYSEIKAYAMLREGMENASMEFDIERLCPTYRVFVGIPGRSNAFEIARRLGLDESVISLAEQSLKNRDVAFEEIIAGAQDLKQEAEREHREADAALKEAEALRSSNEAVAAKLEQERQELRKKAKEEARKLVQETRAEMEELIRTLRASATESGRALEQTVQKSRDSLRASESRLMTEMDRKTDDGVRLTDVKPGDPVYVRSLDREAVVLKAPTPREEVFVQVGIVKTTVPLSDLRPVRQEARKSASRVRLQPADPERGYLSLDLRGRMVDEAELEIDRFIDDCRLTGVKEFTVIHGKGTGALRTGVQSYLKGHPAVKTYRIGAYGEGDAGVTVVTLK